MNKKAIVTALAALSLALPLRAADPAKHPEGGSTQLTELASTYNVQDSELTALREKGWSWNEIGNALAVSKKAGKPLQEVVTQRDSGMGWNQIANQYGFKFNEVSREAKQIAKKGNRADKEARKQGEAIKRGGEKNTEQPTTPGTMDQQHPSQENQSMPQAPETRPQP